MVYKKYIKKDGKLYGPYYYHSRRVDGKVISEYHGSEKKTDYKKFIWAFLGVFLLIFLIYGLTFIEKKISGEAILSINADYQEGQPLEGNMRLVLRDGELIPVSSKIIFETSEQKYEYNLYDFISEQPVEGDFYIEGKSFSGNGLGYGVEGIKDVYQDVYFTLNVYSGKSGSGGETPSIPPETKKDDSDQEIPPEKEKGAVGKGAVGKGAEKSEEKKKTPVTGNIISNLFGGISNLFKGLTGTSQISLEIGDEIQGKISVGNDFIYELRRGQTAEIVQGSVRTDSKELSGDVIELNIVGDKAIVTTDYLERESGFGKDYLGDKEKEILIDLSGMNMIFERDELKISLVYGEEKIISLTAFLEEGKIIGNETSLEELEQVVISNRTEIFLTDEERSLLLERFGNDSIKITKAERAKRILIRYELRSYWFEATYDVDISKEFLEMQMESDKIKWLKDIVKSLTQERTSPEEIGELIGDYSI